MKNIFAAGFCLVFSFFCFSQEEWKPEELEVLNRFGLDTNDPRGIIFHSDNDCIDGKYQNVKVALEAFLNASLKKDLTEYCIIDMKKDEPVETPLDIHRIIKLYLENIKD